VVKWKQKFFIHLGKLKMLPEISNTDRFVADISQPQQRVVSLATDLDWGLFDLTTNFSGYLGALSLDLVEEILCHLVTRYADQVCIEFKSLVWFESDIYLLFWLCIDDALMIIKSEALLKDLLNQAPVLRRLLIRLRHLQLNVKVAVAAISNYHRQCLAEANSNSPKI
jgi:hypothetical protein